MSVSSPFHPLFFSWYQLRILLQETERHKDPDEPRQYDVELTNLLIKLYTMAIEKGETGLLDLIYQQLPDYLFDYLPEIQVEQLDQATPAMLTWFIERFPIQVGELNFKQQVI